MFSGNGQSIGGWKPSGEALRARLADPSGSKTVTILEKSPSRATEKSRCQQLLYSIAMGMGRCRTFENAWGWVSLSGLS